MILIACLLVFALAVPSFEQNTAPDTPKSPCPNVFNYEPSSTEPGRWYGVVNLSTDSTLYSLWLNIVLDSKADILGNWVGDVTTQDNMDFKIENTDMSIVPGPAVAVRFFVQYNSLGRTPKLKAIRLNGREICNANLPRPSVDSPEDDRRPETNRPKPIPPVRPQDVTRPVQGRPTAEPVNRPVYVRPGTQSPVPSNINGGDVPVQNVHSRPTTSFQATPTPPRRTTSYHPSSIDDFDSDNGNNGDTEEPEYFGGGQPVIVIPPSTGSRNKDNNASKNKNQCGKVVLNNPIPLVVNGTPTLEGQWPWQIALYQTQTVDNKYICGGTLVSHRHIITAAHCVTRKGSRREVNQNTLMVYLGKHNLRTSVDGVQIRFVESIKVYPEYNATTFSKDLAILQLKEPVSYTDWVRPACLWPDNEIELSNIIGKKGSVVGWGFDDKGVATEELSLVDMPVVDTETCIRSYSEFFVRFTSDYTYCAGYRDGRFNEQSGAIERTSVCNGDSGGGMVFKNSGTWYLRGLVSLSVARHNEYRCDPTHYVIFTDLAKFLPWIKENVFDY